MTTTEVRTALHHRLSTALEAALGAAAVWAAARTCPQGHENWPNLAMLGDGIANLPEAEVGELCVECASTVSFEAYDPHRDDPAWHPEWRIGRGAPVDWDDPAILWPRWEGWVSDWIGAGGSVGRRMRRITDTRVAMRTAIDAWREMEEPSVTAALASAWDALLAKEGKVRDGG